MPLTLDKLFSRTVVSTLKWEGETVRLVWAPTRYTGAMDDQAAALGEDSEKASTAVAAVLDEAEADAAALLEAIEDGASASARAAIEATADGIRASAQEAADALRRIEDRKTDHLIRANLAELLVSWDLMDGKRPLPINEETLSRLPPIFVRAVFAALAEENQPDPQNAPSSNDGQPTPNSAPSRPGSASSKPRTISGSRRGTSNNGRTPSATTRSGGGGR